MNKNKAGLRLAKRIVLGKQKPPAFLRFLAWFTIIWSSIMALFMLLMGIYAYLEEGVLSEIDMLNDFTPKFCFSYAVLHGLSIFSAILMYRKKRTGLYLYTAVSISILALPYILLNDIQFELTPLIFTLIMIGLFFTQIKKME